MREIKFRRPYVRTNGEFSHFSIWGPNIGKTAFTSPGSCNFADEKEDQQFTGLIDKNGNEIFEGDILRYPSKDEWDKINFACYEVFFHDGDANSDYNIGFSMNRSYYHGSVSGGYIPAFKPKQVSEMVIIGNIYEFPEVAITPQPPELK
jgi:uncharacterized phage protein (TIGR01671 family)